MTYLPTYLHTYLPCSFDSKLIKRATLTDPVVDPWLVHSLRSTSVSPTSPRSSFAYCIAHTHTHTHTHTHAQTQTKHTLLLLSVVTQTTGIPWVLASKMAHALNHTKKLYGDPLPAEFQCGHRVRCSLACCAGSPWGVHSLFTHSSREEIRSVLRTRTLPGHDEFGCYCCSPNACLSLSDSNTMFYW